MKRFLTRDTEAGNVIESFDTITEAKEAIRDYEEEDMITGLYTPDFYEVYDAINETVL